MARFCDGSYSDSRHLLADQVPDAGDPHRAGGVLRGDRRHSRRFDRHARADIHHGVGAAPRRRSWPGPARHGHELRRLDRADDQQRHLD